MSSLIQIVDVKHLGDVRAKPQNDCGVTRASDPEPLQETDVRKTRATHGRGAPFSFSRPSSGWELKTSSPNTVVGKNKQLTWMENSLA